METQPTNLFNIYKVNKVQKGFIEIKNDNEIIEKLISLLELGSDNQNDILSFVNSSLLLGTYQDKVTLNQMYKSLIKEASEKFEDIKVYNALTELSKLCWEISIVKFN